jgi:hypothetical protein
MHQPDIPPPAASQPAPRTTGTHAMRFAVTCWVPAQYGDTVDADTVLAVLRRCQEAAGDPAAAAAAIAAIQAGGPVGPAHLETIAAALEEDGQAVSTAGEPLAADAATDFTVQLLQDTYRADQEHGTGPASGLGGLLGEARHALAGLAAAAAGDSNDAEIEAGHDVADVLRRLVAALDGGTPAPSGPSAAAREPGPIAALFALDEVGCPVRFTPGPWPTSEDVPPAERA